MLKNNTKNMDLYSYPDGRVLAIRERYIDGLATTSISFFPRSAVNKDDIHKMDDTIGVWSVLLPNGELRVVRNKSALTAMTNRYPDAIVNPTKKQYEQLASDVYGWYSSDMEKPLVL